MRADTNAADVAVKGIANPATRPATSATMGYETHYGNARTITLATQRITVRVPLPALFISLFIVHTPAWADDAGTVLVSTVPAHRADIGSSVTAYGVIGASQADLSTISFPYALRIDRLLVQAGQRVKQGAILLTATPDPAALLMATQARSGVDFANSEYRRMESLYAQHLATGSQLALAHKSLADAESAFQAQIRSGIATGTLTVKAPRDGVVSQVGAAQGDRVAAGAGILQFSADTAPGSGQPNVLLQIEPDAASQLRVGDKARITGLSTALLHAPVEGTVTRVGAAIDAQSHQVSVGVDASFRGTAYLPGTAVMASIETATAAHWIVPRLAVSGVNAAPSSTASSANSTPSPSLFQLGSDGKAHQVAVTIATERAQEYGVDGPLNPADAIIVDGSYEVTDKQAVRVVDRAAVPEQQQASKRVAQQAANDSDKPLGATQ